MYLHWILIKNLFLLLNSLDLVSTVKERWRKGWWQFSWNFQSVSSSQISLILTLPRFDQRPLKEPGGAATNYRLTYSPHGRFSEGPYKPNWTEEPRHFLEGHYPWPKRHKHGSGSIPIGMNILSSIYSMLELKNSDWLPQAMWSFYTDKIAWNPAWCKKMA